LARTVNHRTITAASQFWKSIVISDLQEINF